MTEQLFLTDAYTQEAPAHVTEHTTEGGLVLNESVFYATGGGQPGDTGRLSWSDGAGEYDLPIITTVKGEAGRIVLIPAEGQPLPAVGQEVVQTLDWDRRFGHMRVHTALHLLSVVIPLPVSGGSIGAEKGRLDFNMPEAPEDKQALEDALNTLIAGDLTVSERWITEDELDANPDLVKTMSVAPPRGTGRIRLVRIGSADEQIDLQPCGGTHVRSTAEIGPIRLGKVEKKGKQNRRVYLHLGG
ncbi:threonyl/alanyl tRNA synthetase-like protein [Phaeobacter piscinae]|nr:alanyl-tRNA editing protein [Phaeobacter piscinae]AUR35560.1 threonyl/alanyl tRNA synthetase-like protein [Phaeobacter piscinae]